MNVVCNQYSTVISESTRYPSGGSACFITCARTQWVDVEGTADTAKFLLPNFTQPDTCCPIIQYETSTVNTAVTQPGSNFMKDPVQYTAGTQTQHFQQVAPHDVTAHQKYHFYVFATAEGGETHWSNQFTLIVGCTPDAS